MKGYLSWNHKMCLEALGLVGLLATSCATDNLAVWTSYDHKTGLSISPSFGIFYTGYDSYCTRSPP